VATTINPQIPEDTIRIRSYEIWEREGRPEGQHVDHWLQALEELRAEALTSPAPERGARPAPSKPRAPRAKKS
jgi:hypothetical protein